MCCGKTHRWPLSISVAQIKTTLENRPHVSHHGDKLLGIRIGNWCGRKRRKKGFVNHQIRYDEPRNTVVLRNSHSQQTDVFNPRRSNQQHFRTAPVRPLSVSKSGGNLLGFRIGKILHVGSCSSLVTWNTCDKKRFCGKTYLIVIPISVHENRNQTKQKPFRIELEQHTLSRFVDKVRIHGARQGRVIHSLE